MNAHTTDTSYYSRLLNFVNIHLFHDDDNLIALEKVTYSIGTECILDSYYLPRPPLSLPLSLSLSLSLSPSQTPSVYTGYRQKALQHTLRGVSTNLGGVQEPIYIYGDFNFRLNIGSVLRVSQNVITCNT